MSVVPHANAIEFHQDSQPKNYGECCECGTKFDNPHQKMTTRAGFVCRNYKACCGRLLAKNTRRGILNPLECLACGRQFTGLSQLTYVHGWPACRNSEECETSILDRAEWAKEAGEL